MRVFYILLAGVVLSGCGGDSSNEQSDSGSQDESSQDESPVADAGNDAPYPAFTIDAPQVVSLGGPVLANPKVQPVFFPGFAYATELADFTSKVGASQFWSQLTEYKVGAITQSTPITLTDADAPAATITDAQIQAWLSSRWDGTHPEFGTAPDSSTIYTLYYPSTTTIYLTGGPTGDAGAGDAGAGDAGGGNFGGSKSCSSFGGYHSNIVVGNTQVPYAVIPQCATFGQLSGVDVITATSSHELSEASTDPYVETTPAYVQTDDDHFEWMFFLGGGEIGDMCAQFPSSFYKPTDIGYYVQRNWSNAAATAGHDPCVPADGTPYANTMPVFTDTIATHGVMTKGIDVPVGQSKVLELDLFSDAPTSPWTVSAQVITRGGGQAPITLTFDNTTGQNGDKLNLTVQSTGALTGGNTQSKPSAALVITSTLGQRENLWIGVIGQ